MLLCLGLKLFLKHINQAASNPAPFAVGGECEVIWMNTSQTCKHPQTPKLKKLYIKLLLINTLKLKNDKRYTSGSSPCKKRSTLLHIIKKRYAIWSSHTQIFKASIA